MLRPEEDHARLLLERELGLEFEHHDDGSKSKMPDLLSVDRMHVAEVITTASPALREAEHHLRPFSEPLLPHCVWVTIPYAILGGLTNTVQQRIAIDIRRWTARCEDHWSSHDLEATSPGVDPVPMLGMFTYDDGIQVLCTQLCRHAEFEPHQISWSVTHEPSPDDPWELIRRSLGTVDAEQRGGVQALAEKLTGYAHKHLVIYPFGPPGNVTAAFGQYVHPSNVLESMPPRLKPPLSDIHLWLLYKYDERGIAEGLHLCSGHWGRFGDAFPRPDLTSPLQRRHYGEV